MPDCTKKRPKLLKKAAALLIKGVLTKYASYTEMLEAKVAELQPLADECLYTRKAAALTDAMINAGIISADDRTAQMDEIRAKYASADSIPDPEVAVDVFRKTAGAFGLAQEKDQPNDYKAKYAAFLTSH